MAVIESTGMDLLLDFYPTAFAEVPSVAALHKAPKRSGLERWSVAVHRSMPIEFITKNINFFAWTWEGEFDFSFSGYDPAISELADTSQAKLHFFWVDWRLLQNKCTPEQAVELLANRIEKAKQQRSACVLINNWPVLGYIGENAYSPLAGARRWTEELNYRLLQKCLNEIDLSLVDLNYLSHVAGEKFFDRRNDTISNYPFSAAATLRIAQHLGLQQLPAIFRPRLKAIVLDLDNTLYAGILGEQGPANVVLTEGHQVLQSSLKRLKQSGLFLAVCSKNNIDDVKTLFATREDFPLKWDDFSVVTANWDKKSGNVARILSQLNVHESAVLFVDDNIAELAEVTSRLQRLCLLHAQPDGGETCRRLLLYPGLYQNREDAFGERRTQDIQANEERMSLRLQSHDPRAYLKDLQMKIMVYENERSHISRFHEMSHKFNQFNLCLARLSEAAALAAFEDDHLTVTVSLSDRFSDSGIVGAFSARVVDTRATLIEGLYSCRALGRDVETLTFLVFLRRLQDRGVVSIDLPVARGERNEIARNWIFRFIKEDSNTCSVATLVGALGEVINDFPADVAMIGGAIDA